jgi:hypothetical protein
MVAIDGSELYAPDGTLVASSSKQEILQNLNLFDIKSGRILSSVFARRS